MTKNELKEFLDAKVEQYNRTEFLASDPIQIPHLFTQKEDIEISAFLTATIAWGNRKSIINNAIRMMELFDNAPFDFITNHQEDDLNKLTGFVHRTFNDIDLKYFIRSLRNIYTVHGGLEKVFSMDLTSVTMQPAISDFKKIFSNDWENIVEEGIGNKIGFGLFLDMHGHGHEIQRLELGYLLSGDELKLDAEELNQENFVEDCSIAHLVGADIQNLSLSELLKGEQSFGSLIDAQSYPAVPSSGDPFPADDPYFTGGFNTARYGSRDGGVIDAIQIECNQEVRFTESERKLFVHEMASTS